MKGYIAVFVCLRTKAMHLEAVSSLDSRNFLQAFKRFTSRRGLCNNIYSDCGTNFVEADVEIKEIFLQHSVKNNAINNLSVFSGNLIHQLHQTLEDSGRQQLHL